jgi:hypothetical protein
MERVYGLVVFCLAVAILWEGRKLIFGTFRSPGSGMFPDLIAGLMLFLSLLLMLFPQKLGDRSAGPSVSKGSTGRLLLVFVALFLYGILLESLGFVIVSFLLTTLLFAVFGVQSYKEAVWKASISTGLAYVLFEVLLKSNLPRGILGF